MRYIIDAASAQDVLLKQCPNVCVCVCPYLVGTYIQLNMKTANVHELTADAMHIQKL